MKIKTVYTLVFVLIVTVIGELQAQKLESELLLKSDYYDMNPTISPDGKTLIFLRQIAVDKEDKLLFFEMKLEFTFTSQAAFNSAGNRIYFDAELQGGEGGDDIYFSEYKNGFWQPPINLGKAINSPVSELSPWVSETGDLYYHGGRIKSEDGQIYISVTEPDVI